MGRKVDEVRGFCSELACVVKHAEIETALVVVSSGEVEDLMPKRKEREAFRDGAGLALALVAKLVERGELMDPDEAAMVLVESWLVKRLKEARDE